MAENLPKLTALEKATLGLSRVQAVPLRNAQGAITHQYDAELGYVFDMRPDGMLRIDFPSWNEREVLFTPELAEKLYHFLQSHFNTSCLVTK